MCALDSRETTEEDVHSIRWRVLDGICTGYARGLKNTKELVDALLTHVPEARRGEEGESQGGEERRRGE